MFKNVPSRLSTHFHGQKLTLETGLLAQQATSSVLASIGQTTVMANVVIGSKSSADYFPMQVIYEEKLYASGKIKGSRFIKREGRPTENAILTGRMIDRSLRSLFDSSIRNELQVIVTVLSLDEVNPPDTLSVLAASTALKLATEDFAGPVASVRIGLEFEKINNLIYEKISERLQQVVHFENIEKYLKEASRLLHIDDQDDKYTIREISRLLAKKDTSWAKNFSEIYKNTPKVSRQAIRQEYKPKPNFEINPGYLFQERSELDLVISGDGDNIVMVESGANIISEEIIGEGLDIACEELKKLVQFEKEFISQAREKLNSKPIVLEKNLPEEKYTRYWSQFRVSLERAIFKEGSREDRTMSLEYFKELHLNNLEALNLLIEKEKLETVTQVRDYLVSNTNDLNHPEVSQILGEPGLNLEIAQNLIQLIEDKAVTDLLNIKTDLLKGLEKNIKQLIQSNILDSEKRVDGRRLDEVRKLDIQVDVLPRVHGSAVFQRGETQVLNVLTLGTLRDAQTLDDMEDFQETTKRYLHHYNFPAYSVGETGRYFGPGRREIGHGALAEKALLPVLPSQESFPYTMRLVSECLGSNGSTSMASTCASTLSLLAGGVPIQALVAGVAMGLVIDSQNGYFKILTDIQGLEDHYGDMDFKVTGTEEGVTAIQLDNKVAGLTANILKDALLEAKKGRLYILTKMNQVINAPRPELSDHAPRVITLQIPTEKIGDVIGPSGKTIKGIIQKYEVEIDIEDDGKGFIYSKDAEKAEKAKSLILRLTTDFKVGDTVVGRVFRIESYGAFLKLLHDGQETGKEALIHISNLSKEHVKNVEDKVKMGDVVEAKILEINDKGQIGLSLI